MIGFFVRAYYETTGDFASIENQFFYTRVEERAAKERISPIEFCYRCLGFAFDNIYSAEQRAEFRKQAVDPANIPLFCEKFSIKGSKDPMPILKKYGLYPLFSIGNIPSCKDIDLVKTLTNYIEHTEHLTVFDSTTNQDMPLGTFFVQLKYNQDLSKLKRAVALYSPYVARLLKTVIVSDKVDRAEVIDGVIRTPKPFDIDTVSNSVCLQIGCRYYSMLAKHYMFLLNSLSMYSANFISNPTAYLGILDIANCYKTTVKDVINQAGFSYVDQLQIYEDTGVFIYQLSHDQYEIINPNHDKFSPISLNLCEFEDFYTKGLLPSLKVGD